MSAQFVDSHCHLDQRRFDADREEVIQRAVSAGVKRMVTIGASGAMQANHDALALAASHDFIFATVGIHPHEAKSASDAIIDELRQLARKPKVVGIGETGLDYYYDHSPRPVQQDVFRRFIHLARELGLPLSIHLRDAYDDAIEILRGEKAQDVGGVIHCFSSDRLRARQLLDLGFDLSFSGTVTFKNADELRAVAREVPEDRFMIETDAPFLAPMPHRGKRNEPAFVLHTAAAIAAVRDQSLEAVAALTTATATRRFQLDSDRRSHTLDD